MHPLMNGPCHYCRRAMNWLAYDSSCLPICRYCLGYLLELCEVAPSYAVLLNAKADEAARRRGDPNEGTIILIKAA